MDLGADTGQTFRHVTLPTIGTALVAGALLAFALSFDEIIVTTFTSGAGTQTLPIWIFSNYQRPGQVPLVNVALGARPRPVGHPGLPRRSASAPTPAAVAGQPRGLPARPAQPALTT